MLPSVYEGLRIMPCGFAATHRSRTTLLVRAVRPVLPALGRAGYRTPSATPISAAASRDGFARPTTAPEGTDRDPFEAVPGWRGYHRIRARADGACGFLSAENRCRLHEELGAASKPLTCRMFPFKFHPASASVVVTASFGCPTIVANRGELVVGRRDAPRARGHLAGPRPARHRGRVRTAIRRRTADRCAVDPHPPGIAVANARRAWPSTRPGDCSRGQGGLDLRANVQRIAQALDDLTRSRVLRLADADFAEYIKLTLPYAAAAATPVAATHAWPPRPADAIRVSLCRGGHAVCASIIAATRAGRFASARLRLLAALSPAGAGRGSRERAGVARGSASTSTPRRSSRWRITTCAPASRPSALASGRF